MRAAAHPRRRAASGGPACRASGVLAGIALLTAGAVGPANAEEVRLAYLTGDSTLPGLLSAWKAVLVEHPHLRDRVSVRFVTESLLDDVDPEEVLQSDVLVLHVHDQHTLERFDETHAVDLVGRIAGQGLVLGVGEGLLPREHYVERGVAWDRRARAFWEHSGFANQVGLLEYALSAAGVAGLTVPEPRPSPEAGYYYPDPDGSAGGTGGSSGRVFAAWEAFDAWRRAAGKRRPGAPRVAVGFYGSNYYDGDTALIDAVIAEIERQGAEAIPIFGYPAGIAFETLLRDPDGAARADVALAFLFRFAGPDAGESLRKLDVPVLSLISLYGRSEAEWRASAQGLSMFEGTFQVAVPELAGLVAPTVVGSKERRTDPDTGLTVVASQPIASRVATAVRRALGYAALAAIPNAGKRVAVLFYNYPPGKAGIGASYLNVAESLANVLRRMRAAGYDLGGSDVDLSSGALLDRMTTRARNVGGYAPGELDAMLARGGAPRAWMGDYLRWLDGYAPELREKVIADWGRPEDATLMAKDGGLIIPALRFGNVAVLPQPARGWGEDGEKLYHARDLAPHHQYVATYSWLRAPEPLGFGADAVVHLGTHGTLEWLDGKDLGLSAADAPDALIADLPNLYVYNVDVVGEGLVARRRGMATLVDHMVPPFVKSGLLPELAALSESVDDYHNNVHKNVQLAEAYADEIRRQAVELGMVKDLGLDLGTGAEIEHDTLHAVEDYLIELRGQNIPYGLHAFGRTPGPEMRAGTVEAIVSVDRDLLPNDATVTAADMERRIVESGPRELDHLLHALGGGYVPAGNGGEPVRNPDAYPTGKNFYGIDPDKVPKPAAWNLGVFLAERLLKDHVAEHGRYPEKVSFVIWGAETMRHEGVLESQIFHLLGTRPVWDARGKVVDVEVVPARELGRPRVDVVIASAAEGMFNNVTRLMDEAVQRVKVLEEAENFVRRHYLATKAALMDRGYAEEEAGRRAGVRIFDEPPGTFNLNTSRIAAASGTWDSDRPMADEYLSKMGHGYGNGFWGEPMEDVFRLALSGTDKVVHSSSSMLYGALDNDDFFMYVGGLAAAVRSIDGESPQMVVTNTRDPGQPEMTGIDKFLGAEFRTRYVNPTWIEGMQREGYAGAGEMRAFVEYLWGWDATVPETVDDAMWNESFAVYVEDRHDLDLKAFFDEHSPHAYQDITGRMVETIRKGYWAADDATTERLLREHVESVAIHGVGCSEHTCGNPRLLRYVLEQGAVMNVPGPALEAYRAAVEAAIGADVETAAAEAEEFVRWNESRPALTTMNVEGFRMEESADAVEPLPVPPASGADDGLWTPLRVGVPVLGLLAIWRWRRHRR